MRPVGLAAVLTALLLLAPGDAAAQPARRPPAQQEAQPQTPIPGGGFDLFRAFLDRAGVKPITTRDLRNYSWSGDEIVIVLGDPDTGNAGGRWAGDGSEYVGQALRSGGAVLIAADTRRSIRSNRRWENFPLITGGRVECPDPRYVHQDRDRCPYAVPVGDFGLKRQGGPVTEVFAGRAAGRGQPALPPLTRVATNSPSWIRVQQLEGEFQYPLARFPRGCLVRDDFGDANALPADAVFAVGGDGPDLDRGFDYRFLALADHSVFINQMLLEPGTDNLELTYRVIDYLRGPEKRDRCLFIENGRVVERFDDLRAAFAPPKPDRPPIPPFGLTGLQEKLVELGNNGLKWVEERDLHNRIVLGSEDPDRRARRMAEILRFLVFAGAIWAAWFVLRKVWGSRRPTDVPPPPLVAGAPVGSPGVFDRRQKELVRRNNVYEPVRDLLREFFSATGVRGEPGARLPRLVIADAVRKPDSLRQAIKDLWRLAFGPPATVTVARWRELEPYFERVRQAHTDGKWRFDLEPAATA